MASAQIEYVKKRDLDKPIHLVDKDGVDVSLVGALVKIAVRDFEGGDVIKAYSSAPGATEGTILIDSPATAGNITLQLRVAHFASYFIPDGQPYLDLVFDVTVKLSNTLQIQSKLGSKFILTFRLWWNITDP